MNVDIAQLVLGRYIFFILFFSSIVHVQFHHPIIVYMCMSVCVLDCRN